MVTCRDISPFPLLPEVWKVEGWDFRRKVGRPKRIFRRPPFVTLVADGPNGIIRRQAFEQNIFFTEDRQNNRNISTPPHPIRASDRFLTVMLRVRNVVHHLWVNVSIWYSPRIKWIHGLELLTSIYISPYHYSTSKLTSRYLTCYVMI